MEVRFSRLNKTALPLCTLIVLFQLIAQLPMANAQEIKSLKPNLKTEGLSLP